MSLRSSVSLLILASLVGCNSPPPVPEVSIEPDAPNTADELVAKAVSVDSNGDDVTFEYTWFKDGDPVQGLSGPNVSADRTARGESWRVEVVARDASASSPSASAAVEIGNAPPSCTALITPTGASAGDDLMVVATGDDADADPIQFTYAWTRNGTPSDAVTDTVSANLTSVGDTWAVTATPRDEDGDGVPCAASVDLTNGPPTIQGISFDPSPVTAANDAHAIVDATDEDGDPLTAVWSWKVGTVDAATTTDTLPRSEFQRGDVLMVSVTVSDGNTSVGPFHEMVTVVNAVPTVDGVELSPTTVVEATTVTCTALGPNDADGDNVTLSYAWKLNGVSVSATGTTLTGLTFNKGDEIQCFVTARDATVSGVYPSGVLTVGNTPPVITSAALSTSSPQTGDTLALTLNGPTDADGDATTVSYEWYVNGALAGTDPTLPPSEFAAGQVVYAIVTPTDGTDTGTPVRTTSLVVRNGRPAVTGVTFLPTRPVDGEDLIAQPIASDPESDAMTFTYAWKVNNVLVSGATTDHLQSTKFARGNTVSVILAASDAGGAGAPYTGTTTIQNALPTVAASVLSPASFNERSTISCVGTGWFDADGDGPPVYSIAWYVNDVKQNTRTTLDGAYFSRDDVVRCSLMPFDGTEFGEIVDSAPGVVSNAAPTAQSVTLSDSTPQYGDSLTAVVNGLADPDAADAGHLTATVVWWVNDTLVGTDLTLPPGAFTRGDQVYAIATPFDGMEEGTPVFSAVVTVTNTAPVLTSASITPSTVYTNDMLMVNSLASDVDGDSLTFSYIWKVNDITVASGSVNHLTGSYFSKGDRVKVIVTASDGTATSNAITTNAVTVLNSLPTAPSVRVSPRWARPGVDPLVCSLVTNSTDADLDTITYRMTWTRNGVPHVAGGAYTGPTQATWPGDTIPATDLANGQTWVCTATAYDTAAGGSATDTARAANLDLISMDAGTDFTCGLTSTGEARCWGYNASKQALPPSTPLASVAVGPDGACGLTSAGAIICWGNVPTAQSGTWRQVGVGDVHACGLSVNGSISCWGTNFLGNLASPGGTWSSIAVGSYHACALNSAGVVQCWGANDRGQTTPPSGQTFVEIAAGGAFSCGRHSDGTLACWGDPLLTSPPSGAFTTLVAGNQHACAVDTTDQIKCWGSPGVDLTPPAGTYAVVAAGVSHTCAARTTGGVECWGEGASLQLIPSTLGLDDISAGWGRSCGVDTSGGVVCWGDNTLGAAAPPAVVNGVSVVTGERHGCALDSDGVITCWGDNNYGQVDAPLDAGFKQIEAGRNFNCGIDAADALQCWGDDSSGQATPPSTGAWVKVSAGEHHACAVDALGAVTCWGANLAGETIVPIGAWKDIAAGTQHTCGVHADGTLQCWGVNSFNQTSSPGGVDFVQIEAGLDHTCARRSVGSLACWGSNLYNRATPPTGTFIDLSVGNFHSCATLTTGRNVCWGLYGM